MKILYVGDIMGEAGIKVIESVLPALIVERQVDFVIAQAENVSDGKGMAIADYERLKNAGIHAFTGGNWTMHRTETESLLDDENIPVTRPANYPVGTPGKQYKIVQTQKGDVLVVSLLGNIVGKDADVETDNPLKIIDSILHETRDNNFVGRIVNFHGDFSSQKVVIGHYLDGRVSGVFGDHWHVATADARILPNGTAHITDVGMCGSLDSSLGVKFDSVLPRWRDNLQTKNVLETEGMMQFNAVLIEVDETTGRAHSIEQIITHY